MIKLREEAREDPEFTIGFKKTRKEGKNMTT
jgi:hypothetical protein